jgi:hypothetical protein
MKDDCGTAAEEKAGRWRTRRSRDVFSVPGGKEQMTSATILTQAEFRRLNELADKASGKLPEFLNAIEYIQPLFPRLVRSSYYGDRHAVEQLMNFIASKTIHFPQLRHIYVGMKRQRSEADAEL